MDWFSWWSTCPHLASTSDGLRYIAETRCLLLLTVTDILVPLTFYDIDLWLRWRSEVADVADGSILDDGSEDHDEAGDEVDVDTLQVGDLWQGGVGARDESGHGEDGSDAEGNPCRSGVAVKPEGNPRKNNDETRRNVDLDDVVAKASYEVELTGETRIIS